MILYRTALLILAGILLFLVSGARAAAAGPASSTLARPQMERMTMPAGSAAGHASALSQDSTGTRPTSRRTPGSTYVPGASGSRVTVCGSTVTARPGDTMSSIARRCGVAPSTLATGNSLRPTSALDVGQTLVLPGNRAPAPVPTRVPPRPTYTYP